MLCRLPYYLFIDNFMLMVFNHMPLPLLAKWACIETERVEFIFLVLSVSANFYFTGNVVSYSLTIILNINTTISLVF